MSSLAYPISLLRETLRFLVYVLYCIEGGLFLLLAPWHAIWKDNYFFVEHAALRAIGLNPLTRGLVSGLGAALFLHGALEIVRVLFADRSRRAKGTRPEPRA